MNHTFSVGFCLSRFFGLLDAYMIYTCGIYVYIHMYVYVYTYINVGNTRVILQWCASTPKSEATEGYGSGIYIYIMYICPINISDMTLKFVFFRAGNY